MKNYFKISIFVLFALVASAQNKPTNASFKQNFSGSEKKVIIYTASNSLTVEGIAGNEVIIDSDKQIQELPEEAQGLKIVSPGGAVDNTGLGANVLVEGNTMKVRLPKSKYFGNFVVKIPKDVNVSIFENGNLYGKWLVTGMKGEVEAETSYSTLNIKNVSGPIVARCGYGKIYIEYDELNQTRPNSISANGAVDITLPATSKANLKVQAMYGEFFTDFDIQQSAMVEDKKEVVDKKGLRTTTYNGQTVFLNGEAAYDRYGKKMSIDEVNKMKKAEDATNKGTISVGASASSPANAAQQELAKIDETQSVRVINGTSIGWSSPNVVGRDSNTSIGTINGGGVNFLIRSDFGNVYLRKKK